MSTFLEMQTRVIAGLNETPDTTNRDNAINDSLLGLWKALVKVDPGRYLSQKPELLVLDADIIPFEELDPDSYIQFTAMSQLYAGYYEWDAATYWEVKAASELLGIQEIATQLADRQDKITPYC